jgi:hypothetical protein
MTDPDEFVGIDMAVIVIASVYCRDEDNTDQVIDQEMQQCSGKARCRAVTPCYSGTLGRSA